MKSIENDKYSIMLLICGRAPWVVQLAKNLPAMQETQVDSWVRKFPWRGDRLPTSVFLGFPGGSDGKESAWNAGDLVLIPGLGRFPGVGLDKPIQYSCLENSMDRGTWRATVHGLQGVWQDWVTKHSTAHMWNLKSSTKINLFTKQKQIYRHRNKLMITRVGAGEG